MKELFQLFWKYDNAERARRHLMNWIRKAKRTQLAPFKVFVQAAGRPPGVHPGLDNAAALQRRSGGDE